MEAIAQFFLETVFGSASATARRRRAARFAAALGLAYSPGPDESGSLAELEALGLRLNRPAADVVAGVRGGRRVVGFANPGVWDRNQHVAHRFTAVAMHRPAPDLLVAEPGSERLTKQWFQPDARCLPVPVPAGAGRTLAAADPAAAGAVLAALGEPFAHSWMVRANWVVGWRRGHLKPGPDGDLLRFLEAAAAAVEAARS